MIALLLAAAIGQVEDVTDLHERYERAEFVFNQEMDNYNKSIRRQQEAIQREPNEARRRELSDELESYKNEVSPLLFGIRRAVDRMRLKSLKVSPPKDAA